MAVLIKADGTHYTVTLSLGEAEHFADLRRLVDGYVEMIDLGKPYVMVINEDGQLLGLPHNAGATGLLLKYTRLIDEIVGPVVIGQLGDNGVLR